MVTARDFTPVDARTVVVDMQLGIERGGVYGIFFDSGQLLLERSGYLEFEDKLPHTSDGYDLLYVGATAGLLRSRVLTHLKGNSKASSLRMTVGAVLAADLGLEPVTTPGRTYFNFGVRETVLSNWLLSHTRIGFLPCENHYQVERSLFLDNALPFNINERRSHPFSQHLMRVHSRFAGRTRARSLIIPPLRVVVDNTAADPLP